MKRMLFNATHAEELRVAIVDGQKLIDIDIESAGHESRKSNIYKGVVTRVEPSLEACFVNYGEERHGFLPFKEISRTFFKQGVDASKARIQDVISEGTELLVQVDKEERGNKGAALTTYISLAGRYLVLMPNNPRGGGVSRRIEGEDRQELRETMDKLEVPAGMSIIARTAGIGRTAEELQWDLNYLLQLWRAVESAAGSATGAFLIYQESSLVIRAIRDYFTADIGEILIDTEDVCEQARQFMAHVMPDNVDRVKRYRDDVPLFSRFQIEHQIETAYSRLVPLPSGGAIVVDHTEALVAIDVNSARATRGGDIEETALRTNLEAADEAARQMRLRDLGGLIVIDFIDMESSKNQREVEQRLKDALHYDRARVQTGKISRFGLMELSRQRLRPALNEGTHITCPRCNGTGVIRDVESSALHVLRVIQEEAMKESTASIHAQVPVDVATYLLNEKRSEIAKMEARLKVEVVLIPNKHIETPHYKLERLRHDDERLNTYRASYTVAEGPAEDSPYAETKLAPAKPRQEAKVKGVTPEQPAPVAPVTAPVAAAPAQAAPAPASAPAPGLIGRILGFFRRAPANDATAVDTPKASATAAQPSGEARTGRNGNAEGGRRGRDDGRREGRGRSGERGRDGRGRDGRGREERAPRTAQGANPASGDDTARASQEPRREREPRGGSANGEARAEGGRRNSRGGRRSEAPVTDAAEATELPVTTAAGFTVVSSDSLGVNPQADAASPQAAAQPAPQGTGPETQDGEHTSEEGRRRRRRRGGRRGDRSERTAGEAGSTEAHDEERATGTAETQASAEAPVSAQPAPVTGVQEQQGSLSLEVAVAPVTVVPATAVSEPAPVVTQAPAPEPTPVTAQAPAPEPAPVIAQAPAPEPAPVIAPEPAVPVVAAREPEAAAPAPAVAEMTPPAPEPAAAPTPAPAPIDRTQVDSALAGAGLQLIETRSTGSTFDEPPPVPAQRPVRQRRPRAVVQNEPLMQVETDQRPGAGS